MILLTANKLSKSFGVKEIFSDISFQISSEDKIGIVGNNGAGKTTLLNVLAGDSSPSSGEFFMGKNISIGYLKQSEHFSSENTVYHEVESIFAEVIQMEKDLEMLAHEISEQSAKGSKVDGLLKQYEELQENFEINRGFSYKSEIKGILNSMAFGEEVYEKKITKLSGGEKTRLALAVLLLKRPQILFLDEPTNHLDIGTLKWLEQYLKAYNGTLVIISHDRYFLDQVVNKIFELDNKKLFTYDGNYTEFVQKRKFRIEETTKRYESQQSEIKKQEEIIRRFKQHGTEKLAKRARSREKRLEKIEKLDAPAGSNGTMKVVFTQNYQTGNDVIFGFQLSKSFGLGDHKKTLFENISFDIKKGEKICLVGNNGIGKTTLLKIIMGRLSPDQGYVKLGNQVVFGYYDQEQKILTGHSTVLEELHSQYRKYTEGELRNLLGAYLFRGDDVFKEVSNLSGGEKARLALLKIMLSGANVLLMDEPTNHLDISSKEAFEQALMEFEGTVIVVSHDRYFLNKIPDRIFELHRNTITNFLGGYDYYVEKKQSIESGKKHLENLSSDSSAKDLSAKEQNKLNRKLDKENQAEKKRKERQIQQLEREIEEVEDKIISIEEEMCKEENFADHQKLTELQGEHARLKEALEIKYEKWVTINPME